jgi:uncharacterized repeat protein (TIGR01451 family)
MERTTKDKKFITITLALLIAPVSGLIAVLLGSDASQYGHDAWHDGPTIIQTTTPNPSTDKQSTDDTSSTDTNKPTTSSTRPVAGVPNTSGSPISDNTVQSQPAPDQGKTDPPPTSQPPGEEQSLTAAQSAIIAAAAQYFGRGVYIQYDGAMLDKDNPNLTDADKEDITRTSRKQLVVKPEDANAQNTVFMDDGAFIYNVYKLALDRKTTDIFGLASSSAIMSYAVANSSDTAKVPFYTETLDSDLAAELESVLRVGDIVVYIDVDGETHAVLALEDGFIHATGTSFDHVGVIEHVEIDGAIQYGGWAELLSELSEHSAKLAVVRLLDDTQTASTDEATKRAVLDQLFIEKTSSINPKVTVATGQNLTYCIKLQNSSSETYGGIVVTAAVPNGTNLVSGFDSDNALSVTIDLAAGETATLYYTVVVTATSGEIINKDTTVAGFSVNDTTNFIGNTLSDAQNVALVTSANEYISELEPADFKVSGTGLNYRLPPAEITNIDRAGFIRAIYYHAFGVDIRYTSINNAFLSLFDGDTWLKLGSGLLTGDLALFEKMQVPGLYGGRELTTYSDDSILAARTKRARYISEPMLMSGDIVTYQQGSDYEVYTWIYLKDDDGSGQLVRFSKEGVVTKSGDELAELLTNLLAKKRFVVLRPALAFDF